MRSGKRTAACINAMLGAPTLFILSPKQKTMNVNHSSHWMLRRSKRETAFHEGFVAFQIRHGGGGWDGLGRADSSGGEGTGTDSSEATSSLTKEQGERGARDGACLGIMPQPPGTAHTKTERRIRGSAALARSMLSRLRGCSQR